MGFFSATETSVDDVQRDYAPILIPGENVLVAFKTVRDLVFLTNYRLALANVQGLTGREGTFHAKAAQAYHTTVVGGVTPECTRLAKEFYSKFIDTVVEAKGAKEAEMAKLLENTYRYVNMALVDAVTEAAATLRKRRDVKVVVLTGTQKCFSAGADLSDPLTDGLLEPVREYAREQLLATADEATLRPGAIGFLDALVIGLTATPHSEVDRNTYALFGIENNNPTDSMTAVGVLCRLHLGTDAKDENLLKGVERLQLGLGRLGERAGARLRRQWSSSVTDPLSRLRPPHPTGHPARRGVAGRGIHVQQLRAGRAPALAHRLLAQWQVLSGWRQQTGQAPAAAFSASTRSVRSQVNSSSSRPKWP